MKKILVILVSSIVLVSLGFLVFASNSWSQDVEIQEIRVNGTSIIENNEIVSAIDTLVLGKRLGEIDFSKIKSELLRNDFILNLEMYSNSNKFIIDIDERKPVAYYIDNSQVYLLSEDSEVMLMRLNIKDMNLPVLRILDSNLSESKNIINEIFKNLNQNDNLLLYISEILFDKKSEEFEFVLNQNGVRVKFGNLENSELKFQKFEKFWSNIVSRSGINFSIIDLRWQKKVIVS